MLSMYDVTRVGKLEFADFMIDYKNLKRQIIIIKSVIIVPRKKALLLPEELLLVEMIENLDVEAIESSKELCKKIEVLYRFLTSLS